MTHCLIRLLKCYSFLIKNNNKHNNDYIDWQDDKWLMLKMINWTQITKIKIYEIHMLFPL